MKPISQYKMLLNSLLFIFFFGVNTGLAFQKEHPKEITSIKTPFKMGSVPLPQIPDREFIITDFGAVPDGETMNTEAIANAIEACSKAGGGRAVMLQGLPEMPIRNITLEDVTISANKRLACVDAQNINLKNVTILSNSVSKSAVIQR